LEAGTLQQSFRPEHRDQFSDCGLGFSAIDLEFGQDAFNGRLTRRVLLEQFPDASSRFRSVRRYGWSAYGSVPRRAPSCLAMMSDAGLTTELSEDCSFDFDSEIATA